MQMLSVLLRYIIHKMSGHQPRQYTSVHPYQTQNVIRNENIEFLSIISRQTVRMEFTDCGRERDGCRHKVNNENICLCRRNISDEWTIS